MFIGLARFIFSEGPHNLATEVRKRGSDVLRSLVAATGQYHRARISRNGQWRCVNRVADALRPQYPIEPPLEAVPVAMPNNCFLVVSGNPQGCTQRQHSLPLLLLVARTSRAAIGWEHQFAHSVSCPSKFCDFRPC